jgi:hypothetical protein
VQDALLVIPPLRLSEALLYYYTILDPGLPILSFLPIYLSTTLPKPQHTVNMRYQLIALPALAATVAAQDL